MSDSNGVSFDIAPFDFDSLMDTQKATANDSQKAFPCADCGKIFHHSSSLGRHRAQKHLKGYVCQLCEAQLENADDLRSHLHAVHGFVKPMTCRCCEWMFADLTSVNAHIKSIKETGVHAEDIQVLAKPANTEDNADDAKSLPRPTGPPAKRRKVSKPTAKRTAADEAPASATGPVQLRGDVLKKVVRALKHATNCVAADPTMNLKREPSVPSEVNNNEVVLDEENRDPLAVNAPKATPSAKVNKRKAFVPVQIKVEDLAESEEPLPKKFAAQPVLHDDPPVEMKAEADDDSESSSSQNHLSEARIQALIAAQLVPRDASPELRKLVEELVRNIQ